MCFNRATHNWGAPPCVSMIVVRGCDYIGMMGWYTASPTDLHPLRHRFLLICSFPQIITAWCPRSSFVQTYIPSANQTWQWKMDHRNQWLSYSKLHLVRGFSSHVSWHHNAMRDDHAASSMGPTCNGSCRITLSKSCGFIRVTFRPGPCQAISQEDCKEPNGKWDAAWTPPSETDDASSHFKEYTHKTSIRDAKIYRDPWIIHYHPTLTFW